MNKPIFIEELNIGMSKTIKNMITDEDIVAFSKLTGDTNPIHLDEKFAEKSVFGKKVAHGFLYGSFISAVLGSRLPGPGSVYISQTLKFLSPVYINDVVTTTCTIKEIDLNKNRVWLDCNSFVGSKKVVEGLAVLKVPSKQ